MHQRIDVYKRQKFKIGDTLLDNNVFLAPMAGVTDLPFRLLCREQGAGMSVTEMVSAKAILYKNKKMCIRDRLIL